MLTTTLVRVPWFALSYELTAGTYQEKKNLYATREIFYIVGTIGAAALPLIIAVDDVKLQFQIIGAILATVSIFLSFLCFWYVKEPRYGMLEESGNSGGLVQLFSNYWKLFGIIRKNTIAFPFLLGITLFSGATCKLSKYDMHVCARSFFDTRSEFFFLRVLCNVCGGCRGPIGSSSDFVHCKWNHVHSRLGPNI